MDLRAYECGLCTTYLWSPIYKCNNDHSFCENCVNLLQICASCRENLPLPKIRNVALETDIARSWFRCVFRDEGCQEVVKLNRMEHHIRSCKFRTGRHCAVLGFANCDQLISMPRLMNHVKHEHKVTCLSANLYEEFEIKQVICSGIGRPKNVQLARVNWVTIFIFLEGTRNIFQLQTKFVNSDHLGSRIRWVIQERSSSITDHMATISFIKDSSQGSFSRNFCDTWTWVGSIAKENDTLDSRNSWFDLPCELMAGRNEWKLRILIRPRAGNSLGRILASTTAMNEIVGDVNEQPEEPAPNVVDYVHKILENSMRCLQLLWKHGLPIFAGCLLISAFISVIIYTLKSVQYWTPIVYLLIFFLGFCFRCNK